MQWHWTYIIIKMFINQDKFIKTCELKSQINFQILEASKQNDEIKNIQ